MPTSEEFLNPFERTAVTAALRQLGFLERANKLVSLGLTPDVALIDGFIDWYRSHLSADNPDSVKLRPATPQEQSDYHDGYRTFPGAVETEHGLLVQDARRADAGPNINDESEQG